MMYSIQALDVALRADLDHFNNLDNLDNVDTSHPQTDQHASRMPLDPQLKALLLEADPDWDRVRGYLPQSQLFVILDAEQQYIAQLCLSTVTAQQGEIKNLSVAAAYRGQGLAKQLIAHVINLARQQQQQCLWVKTGNSSLDQLALYQKMGFRLDHIEKDVFLDYPEPIFENGIACLDQVVLCLML